ncbi:unnamed protein product [Scytosiphon promiscuus]
MHQKRFLRVGDSGYVNVWLEGVSLSLSLDPEAGAESLRRSSTSSPTPGSSPPFPFTSAAAWTPSPPPPPPTPPSSSSPSTLPARSPPPSAPSSPPLPRHEHPGGSAEGDGPRTAAGPRVSGDGVKVPGAATAAGARAAVGDADGDGSGGGDGGRSVGDGGDGGGSSKWSSKLNSMSSALSKGTGKLKRRLKTSVAATTATALHELHQHQYQREHHEHPPATTFFPPGSPSLSPPSPCPSPLPPLSDAPPSSATSSASATAAAAASASPSAVAAEIASAPATPATPEQHVLLPSALSTGSPQDDDRKNGEGAVVFASPEEFSPSVEARRRSGVSGTGEEAAVPEGGDVGGSSPPGGIGGGGRPGGFLKVAACSCKVGSIRIEVAGSKHDGIYNFLAKGLGDTIRDAVREAVEKAFSEEIEKLVDTINDWIAEIWSGVPPESKKPARVLCAAVRAQGLAKQKGELYVKVRLMQKDGTQLQKHSTAAVGVVASAASASVSGKERDKEQDKEVRRRDPCWVGLDDDLSMDLPEQDAAGLSLVFEVWHSGTITNGIVGSTRRVSVAEVRPPSSEGGGAAVSSTAAGEEEDDKSSVSSSAASAPGSALTEDSDSVWLELDSGGKLLVKLAVTGMTAHRRRNSVNQPVRGDTARTVADAASTSFAELVDSQRTFRRWN